jgi:hypothetical protein
MFCASPAASGSIGSPFISLSTIFAVPRMLRTAPFGAIVTLIASPTMAPKVFASVALRGSSSLAGSGLALSYVIFPIGPLISMATASMVCRRIALPSGATAATINFTVCVWVSV